MQLKHSIKAEGRFYAIRLVILIWHGMGFEEAWCTEDRCSRDVHCGCIVTLGEISLENILVIVGVTPMEENMWENHL